MIATAGKAREAGTLFHTHLCETRHEGDELVASHGTPVPALLASEGVLDARSLAAHCVWVDDADMEILAGHGVSVAHFPQSNAKLGSGIAPVPEMIARGVSVALATDGPASSNNLDLWEEMRLALLLATLRSGEGDRREPLSPRQAIEMATVAGASALGMGSVGSLEVGKQADMIRLETEDPALVPVEEEGDLLSHLVWSGDSRAVTDVWGAGRRLLKERTLTTVDVAEAAAEVQQRARRLAGL